LLIRCDYHDEEFFALPLYYWKPGGAIKFWIHHCGHIPVQYTFRCPICKATMVSGPLRAVEERWDEISLAQNDLGFFQDHAHGAVSLT
jgi:hypothetical protein